MVGSSLNGLPTADAGSPVAVVVGTTVTLDGTGSSDPDGDSLSYAWTLLTRPAGSAATLSGANLAHAALTVDVPGAYTVGLVVNDGRGDSPQATVDISAIAAADYAQGRLSAALNHIRALAASQLQAPGHRNALSNFVQQAITALQAGDGATARSKIVDALARTDGYPLRGAIDGNGPGMDWITDSGAQVVVYQALNDALHVLP